MKAALFIDGLIYYEQRLYSKIILKYHLRTLPFSNNLLATSLANSRLLRARTLYSTIVQKLNVLNTALILRDIESDIAICGWKNILHYPTDLSHDLYHY